MKYTKIAVILLLIALLLPTFAACGDGEGDTVTTTADPGATPSQPVGGDTTTGGGSTVTDPTVDDKGYELDDLDKNLDYNDKTFTVLAWEQSTPEYDVEKTDGDDVEAALYDRNRKVEERLGIELVFNPIPGNTSAVESFIQTVNTSVTNNSSAFDAIAAYTRCAGVLATYGVYYDLYNVEHLNFSKPWWSENIIETNTVSDRIYFLTGDIATSLIYQMEFMIINDDYAADLGIDCEELQQLAIDGKWTLEKMLELSENTYSDIDSQKGKSDGDRFGLYIHSHVMCDMFYVGAGLNYVDSDEEGIYLSDDFGGDIAYDMLRSFSSALLGQNCYYAHAAKTDIALGNSLLYTITGSTLSGTLREAAFIYSVLPAPKYNEAQADYYTAVQFPHSMYSIPVDAPDRDMSGAVLECMASESYRQVTPVLFEKCFKHKYATSPADSEILSIIRDATAFDLGRTFFEVLGGAESPVVIWRDLIEGQSTKIAGKVSKYKSSWNETLKGIYDTLSELE